MIKLGFFTFIGICPRHFDLEDLRSSHARRYCLFRRNSLGCSPDIILK